MTTLARFEGAEARGDEPRSWRDRRSFRFNREKSFATRRASFWSASCLRVVSLAISHCAPICSEELRVWSWARTHSWPTWRFLLLPAALASRRSRRRVRRDTCALSSVRNARRLLRSRRSVTRKSWTPSGSSRSIRLRALAQRARSSRATAPATSAAKRASIWSRGFISHSRSASVAR